MPLFRRKRPEPVAPEPEPLCLPVEPPEPDADGRRSLADHRDFVLELVQPLLPFGVALLDAVGLQVAEAIRSDVDLPGFDNSAMDGYAVRAQDIRTASPDKPVTLPVDGVVAAGDVSGALPKGTARKIMTGAPVPAGADTVVPYEQTDRGEEQVCITVPLLAGQNVRYRGSDITDGDLLVEAGTTLGVRHVGLLAAAGVDKVLVRPRPRVVVIATGSELVEPGTDLAEGELYDSNSYMVAAAAKAAGAQVWRVGHVGDDPGAVRDLIVDQLIRADLIVTTGGVSEGDYDVVKEAVPRLGPCDFTKVAMQPGKPQGVGLIGDDEVPIIMLPGNPVSSYVSFEAFVRPAIRKLMGATPYVRQAVEATATTGIASRAGILQLARGRVETTEQGRMVTPSGSHSSHLVGELAKANALLLLEPETEFLAAGDQVKVWLLDE